MCARSVQELTVGMQGLGLAGATITTPWAAAEFNMLSVGELTRLMCEYQPLVELAGSGRPISQMPKSAS